METKWLEDFVSLAETRSFSRSAQLRHVTQPAFSRRIQALEAWAGTDLVDRSSYPTRLTPAGRTLYEEALDMLQSLQNTRAMLRAHTSADKDMVEFAVPHTLAFTFFPAWLSGLRERFGPVKSRLIALNVHDAVLRLVEGGLRPADRLPPPLAALAAGFRPVRDAHARSGSPVALCAGGRRWPAALRAARRAGPSAALSGLCAGGLTWAG